MRLEGRDWMKIAINDFGAKIVEMPKQEKGYFYIYQVFTTCFVEFNNLLCLKECITYLNKNVNFWDYDPYSILKSGEYSDFMELTISQKEIKNGS